MDSFHVKSFLITSFLCLCGTHVNATELSKGGLANAGNAGPSAIELNLVYAAMNATMNLMQNYATTNNKCPPKGYFKNPFNDQASITNGSQCDIILTFGSHNPGALKNKTIRMVPKGKNGTTPSSIDFASRAVITNIDFGSNGGDESFLLRQLPAYTWSPTLQGSYFGNVPIAPTGDVLKTAYDQILAYSESMNNTSSSSSSGSGSTTANIQSI